MWTKVKALLGAAYCGSNSRDVQDSMRDVLRREGLWDDELGDLRTHREFPFLPKPRPSSGIIPRPDLMDARKARLARWQAKAENACRQAYRDER